MIAFSYTNLLLSMQGLLILAMLAFALHMYGLFKRAKRAQDRLIESLDRNSTDPWFRINVSRPAQFSKKLKFIPFEAKGILINNPDRIRILAELRSGEKIDHSIEKRDLGLRWIGNPSLASSNMHWIAIDSADKSLYLSADTGLNALQSREATADLCRIINPDFNLPTSATQEFAIEKNPASLILVSVFFLILAFAFIDGIIINKNELLEPDWLFLMAPVSIFLAIPSYGWLTRQGVPSRESMVLMLLLGMGFSAACIPAIKRVDQFFSTSGTTPVAYRLGPNAAFEPITPGPPSIDYSRYKEYWEQFTQGSTHYFDLTHGPLGLWQLDHTNLEGKLRDFYNNPTKDKTGNP